MNERTGIGLVLGLVLAAAALLAPAAQGAKFTTGKTPNTHMKAFYIIEKHGGKEDNYFEFAETEVTCEEDTVTAPETEGTDSERTLTPEYSHCMAEGLPVTITMNGCNLSLSEPSSINEEEFTGSFDLECPEEGVISIHTYLFGGVTSHSTQVCTTTVEPENEVGHVHYTNIEDAEKKKDDITTVIESKTVPYAQEGACGSESFTDGKIVTKLTETAHNLDGQLDYWISK